VGELVGEGEGEANVQLPVMTVRALAAELVQWPLLPVAWQSA
jgi:hypothetical protein